MRQYLDDTFLRNATDILGDADKGLSTQQIIDKSNSFGYEYDVDVPISNLDKMRYRSIPNKRTALYENLRCFKAEQQFKIIFSLCEEKTQENRDEVVKLKSKLITKYPEFAVEGIQESPIIVETKHWLESYEESYKLYQSALIKYGNKTFERNLLDDIRLSLELLLKSILNNDKSLEKQTADLGAYLKAKTTSAELRNMMTTLLTYYSQYQNSYVKHNDSVNEVEMDFVVEITSIVMKLLIKLESKENLI